ncbi:hypothetical protein GCM10010517_30730 [Streptosporangium fragile]|uniref:DNA (cytosine-5-)-methyltransferase n=1 Tax=Streptosporangium fragile TaxID=46186 RepID=A0ABN3VZL4_9ACTN
MSVSDTVRPPLAIPRPRPTPPAREPNGLRLLDLFCCAGGAAMGIAWTDDRRELAEAIPPAYTLHIGRAIAAALTAQRQAA